MPVRTKHPRLAHAACRLYWLSLWMYPSEFRCAFGRELAITFRNQVEDVLNGGVLGWVAFAAHIIMDSVRACWLVTDSEAQDSVSLLGLSEGQAALGCLDRGVVDVPLVFAVAGFAATFVGWYTFIIVFPS